MSTTSDSVLTDRQRAFVLNYCKCLNGAKAARDAGYSKETAKDIATENLAKPIILDAIKQETDRRAKELRMEADWVVLQWHDCYIQAREQYDIPSALKALDMIAKFLGMYEKDNRQRSGGSAEEIRNRLKERGIDVSRLLPPVKANEPSTN